MSVDTSETNAETLTLQIEGMHCSCEAGMLERELSCLAGVSSCNVDPISQRARVFFDPSRITTQDIVRSVSAAGMTASLVHEKRQRSTWWKAPQQVALYGCGVTIMLAFVLSLAGAPTLIALMPKEALMRVEGREAMLATENIRVGDIVVVRPGERVPVDGKVIQGASFVDQAAVTGESIPVQKGFGDDVFAGTINQSGATEVRVDKPASETMLFKIILSVEEAQAKKTSYQTFSDSFAKYYTPAMFVLGVLVATVPPLLFGAAWHPFILLGLVSGLLLNEASALVVIFNAVWLLRWKSTVQATTAAVQQRPVPVPLER